MQLLLEHLPNMISFGMLAYESEQTSLFPNLLDPKPRSFHRGVPLYIEALNLLIPKPPYSQTSLIPNLKLLSDQIINFSSIIPQGCT